MTLPDGALKPSSVIKNLCVYVEEQMTMDSNARQCVKSSFYHMRRIRQIHRFVNAADTFHMLVRALILSRLDYCNSLYAGCTRSTLRRLQRVQDCVARLLCDASPRAHASPLRQQVHWLPVSSRIQYKLCMPMHDVYHGKAPGYLADLCVCCGDTRLHSSSRGDFVVQRTRLRLAEKSFSVAGPRTWNSLPSHIRTLVSRDSFSRHLKTHFFKLSYDIQ